MKQPKKCLLCGCLDEGGNAVTCALCGEATWKMCEVGAMPGLELVPVEIEPSAAPKKRGRPKAS